MAQAGVEGCVLVEAGVSTLDEVPWLVAVAGDHPQVKGIVAWGEPADERFLTGIKDLAREPLLKGVRISWYAPRPDADLVTDNLALLADLGLTCDLLLGPAAYTQLHAVIAHNPAVTFILNHLAGARITPGGAEAWAGQLKPLADLPNTCLKISGFLTTGSAAPDAEAGNAHFDQALAMFGAGRLMFGSDWPVCTRYGDTYASAVSAVREWAAVLPENEQRQIYTQTARRVYHLA
jgi:L-fuconolactonase